MSMSCSRKEIFPSTVLHWNYRGFTEFPLRQLGGDEADITDIYLKENLISSLPNDIGRLERLESLYLSGNDIRELPIEIGKLRFLKCLDLTGNRLCRLPEEIGDMRSLKFLILDDNELVQLPLRLADLWCLRYLSVCDNRLLWLPQRPVYNYHHCEFRFWRNTGLKAIPYLLWFHMFREQQTRSLNIGCLGIAKNQSRSRHKCQLKIQADPSNWKIDVDIPNNYCNVVDSETNSPASLLELCKRRVYTSICNTAKILSNTYFSTYSDNCRDIDENANDNTTLQNHLDNLNLTQDVPKLKISANGNIDSDVTFKIVHPINRRGTVKEQCCGQRRLTHYTPADVVKECFDYLPRHIKSDLCNGPISRCENVSCKKPVFDYALFQFCFGNILLIDNKDDAILSAVFCSKRCADSWKIGKAHIIIPWELVSS